jgi:hypothetical protein
LFAANENVKLPQAGSYFMWREDMNELKIDAPYEAFRPIVTAIERGIGTYALAGEGAESKVWRAQVDDKKYAIKIAKQGVLNARGRLKDRRLITERKIRSGLKGVGIDGLEQFVAGSSEDFATVYAFVEGIRLTDFREENIAMVTSGQKERLYETIAGATTAGLTFDACNPSGANAFYTPGTGFTLIDYEEAWHPTPYDENWAAVMRSLGPVALRAFAPICF